MNLYDQISFASSIITIVSFAVGLLTHAGYGKWKQYKIRKALSLSKKGCKIVPCVYTSSNFPVPMEVVPRAELEAFSNIVNVIRAAGLDDKGETLLLEDSSSRTREQYDTFYLGSMLGNPHVLQLFDTYFPSIKLHVHQDFIDTNPLNVPRSRLVCSDVRGISWGGGNNQKFMVATKEGTQKQSKKRSDGWFGAFIKLSKDDLPMKDQGTAHILFGDGEESTLQISKYLLNHYQDLYKRTKGKSHYFILFRITANGTLDFKDCRDIMDEVLRKKP